MGDSLSKLAGAGLPEKLDQRIQTLLAGQKALDLQRAYESLSFRYHEAQQGKNPMAGYSSFLETLAYVAARLPASYAVVSQCLNEFPAGYCPTSLLDLGAGPGTASLAFLESYPQVHPTLVEGSHESLELAKVLLSDCTQTNYYSQSLLRFLEQNPVPSYDVVVASYVLGEVTPASRLTILEQAIQVAQDYILVILPGTPRDFEILRELRSHVLHVAETSGDLLRIVAPCPHALACPMKLGGDWCHFSVRLSRSTWHRRLKSAELSYEDEKYSYLLIAKGEQASFHKERKIPGQGRIVKNPQHRGGHGHVDVCTSDGTLDRVNYSRSKSKNYKEMKNLQWGDVYLDSN